MFHTGLISGHTYHLTPLSSIFPRGSMTERLHGLVERMSFLTSAKTGIFGKIATVREEFMVQALLDPPSWTPTTQFLQCG